MCRETSGALKREKRQEARKSRWSPGKSSVSSPIPPVGFLQPPASVLLDRASSLAPDTVIEFAVYYMFHREASSAGVGLDGKERRLVREGGACRVVHRA